MDKGRTQKDGSKNREINTYAWGLTLERWQTNSVTRYEGGRELANTEDCVAASIQGLEEHIKKSKEILIATANKNKDSIKTNKKPYKNKKTKMGRKTTVWILQVTN